jgi:uncharacterized protein (DUF1778 family)
MSDSEKRRKDRIISLRCTVWQKQLLEKVAAIAGVSVGEFVRSSALKRAEEIVQEITVRADGGAA